MICRLLRGSLLSAFLVACVCPQAQAADIQDSDLQARAESRSGARSSSASFEALRLRFRLLETVEFPLRLREIDSAMKVVRARIASFQRLEAEYARFPANAVIVDLEKARVQRFEQEQKLKDLKFERLLLQESYKQERRWRILELRQALRREKTAPRTETAAAR